MKKILLLVCIALSGCASARQWVSTDDCDQRVVIDGENHGHCRKVSIK